MYVRHRPRRENNDCRAASNFVGLRTIEKIRKQDQEACKGKSLISLAITVRHRMAYVFTITLYRMIIPSTSLRNRIVDRLYHRAWRSEERCSRSRIPFSGKLDRAAHRVSDKKDREPCENWTRRVVERRVERLQGTFQNCSSRISIKIRQRCISIYQF